MEAVAQKFDFNALTAEEKKEFKKQLLEEAKAEKQAHSSNVSALKELAHEFLANNIDALANRQLDIEQNVAACFKELSTYLQLKAETYGVDRLDQDSHTVTHADGSCSITIGHNPGITFDGTETAGVQKIMDYITGLSGGDDDENATKLAKAVKFFLKPNLKTGMLNPGRIIQLNQMRADFNSPEFDDGMDIIVDAQNKTKGSSYVMGWQLIDIGDGQTRKVEFRFTV
jgi:hypothetical protein